MGTTKNTTTLRSLKKRPKFHLPDKKALGPLVIGLALTLVAVMVNHCMFIYRTPPLFVDENRISSGDDGQQQSPNSLLSDWFGTATTVVRVLDDRAFEIMSAMLDATHANIGVSDDIIVVTIDEESIRNIGAWPWSRRDIGRIMAHFRNAKVVGLNLLFYEPDRLSLKNFLPVLKTLYDLPPVDPTAAMDPEFMDNDLFLAREIARCRTVLGMIQVGNPHYANADPIPVEYAMMADFSDGREADPSRALFRQSRGILANIPALRTSQNHVVREGFLNLFSDRSGSTKTVPLFIARSLLGMKPGEGGIYPALALEMLRAGLEADGYKVRLLDEETTVDAFKSVDDDGQRFQVKEVSIVASRAGKSETLLTIPVNEMGEIFISHRLYPDRFKVVPAWEILEGRHTDAFNGKYVLFDFAVRGVGGIRANSVSTHSMPSVFVHAATLDAMLQKDFRRHHVRTDYLWQQFLTIVAGFTVSIVLLYTSPLIGTLASLFVLFFLSFGNYYLLFKNHINAGITVPVASTMTVLVVQSLISYLVMGRERRFIRTAFSLNVSPSILNYLETHPDRLTSLSGEQRDMTVLFSDIRGFTAISENMTAPDLARFLNEYLTPMSDIVMQNLGTVDKFMGDALMAFWNAPTDDPNHARNAARAALGMQAMLGELQDNWTERGLPRLSIGCGINTGPMFAGYMGSEQRKNYTVMGDNVNLASRLEALTKIYSSNIIITQTTRDSLGSAFYCGVVDKVRVSGRREPATIYELLGEGTPDESVYEEIASFARVFELYQMRDFEAAESLLKELMFIRPRPLYDMYMDRLAVYLALPPPDDWDGTYQVTRS